MTSGVEPPPPLYFICYSRVQDEFVLKIEAKLAARRNRRELRWFRDTRSIGVFEPFDQVIRNAIGDAVGAIVIVSDDWHASSYVQDEEWPAIRRKHSDTGGAFGIFPICFHELDDNNPLREHSFVNDLKRELMVGANDTTRDTVLTRLSNAVGGHAKATAPSRLRVVPTTAVEPSAQLSPSAQAPTPAKSAELRPGIHGVPALPVGFVAPGELTLLCNAIRAGSVAGVAGLRGEGGTGKSVLAAAAAREVSGEFSGGVHWVTVGETATEEDVRRLQAVLLDTLGAAPAGQLRDFNEGKDELTTALATHPALVVVDDVWHRWQALAFDVDLPRSPARLLFTTRFPEVLPTRAEAFDVTRLPSREATQFLRDTVGLPDAPEDIAHVIEAAGGLRLALGVMAAVVRTTGGWDAVLSRIDGLAERFGNGDDASSAHKLLHIAADTLDAENRRRLHTFGAFPPHVAVPIDLLAELWRVTPEETEATVHHLADIGLVTREPGGVALHDHAHDYVVIAANEPLLVTQVQLWDLARSWRADGGWAGLRERSVYLWDRLVWHACRAELNHSELRTIGLDAGWLIDRIRGEGVAAAQQDLADICHRSGADDREPISRLRRSLLHGAIFDSAAASGGLEASVAVWRKVAGVIDSAPLAAGALPVPSSTLLRTLTGHSGVVRGVAFNHDGSQLATAGTDLTARVWDPVTGQTVATLDGHSGGVLGVAFNHDGSRVATASSDGTARVWDPVTGQTVATLDGHSGGVLGVAFNHDGSRVVTASSDGTARVWDLATGQTVATLDGHSGGVLGVAFNHDSSRVATASTDGTARLWDPVTGHTVATLDGHTDWVRGVAFNHDSSRVATASSDFTARVWDLATGHTVATLDGHTDWVRGVAFNHDSSRVATASSDFTARVWDPVTGHTVATLDGHSGGVRGVAFSHDGSRVATASTDGTARLWDPVTDQTVATLHGHSGVVRGVAFSHDGSRVATASSDGTARLWDPVTDQTVATLHGHSGVVRGVAFNHDGSCVATASTDGTARLWDPVTGHTVATLDGHSGVVWGVAFNHDDSRVATASDDWTARLWDPVTGETVATLDGHSGGVRGVAFNHDGSCVATASTDLTARLWDPVTGHTVTTLDGHRGVVVGVAFKHDGSQVATASHDGTARLWDPVTGQTVTTLDGHTGGVWGVAFSHDGSRVVTAGTDGTARVWEPNTGSCLLILALACSGPLDWHDNCLIIAAGRNWAIIVPPAV